MPIELTPEARTTTSELLTALTKALETNTPPPPSFNNDGLSVRAYDAYVAPGERVARVPVMLNAPCKQTQVVRCLTANDTATEGNHFVRLDQYIVFQPGEQTKVINIVIKQDLGAKKFKLTVNWPQNDPPLPVPDTTAIIAGDKSLLAGLLTGQALPIASGLMPRPGNLDLAFQENFASGFVASDSGLRPDGSPCWRTKLAHGRTQSVNKELGYYADPVVVPGTDPFPFIDGKLNLQAQYFPDGLVDVNGNPLLCAWDVVSGVQQPFRYTASIVSTQKLFNTIRVGSYVEGKMTMPLAQGCWPALWVVPTDLSWPSIEFDLFEGFFNSNGTIAQVATTVHWKTGASGHEMFSSKLPQLGIDPSLPHTWGMYWGRDIVTFYCNDVPYFAVPNVFPDKDCYLQANVAVGGLVAKPSNPATSFPAKMKMDWVKVWQ